MAPDDLPVNSNVRIPRSEIDVRFSTSGGPGGQHANRVASRVELRFDVERSAALGLRHKQRIIERLGTVVRVVVDDERSQARNRAIAEQRLAARLASALHVAPPRRATRPTKGSKERRLAAKGRRSQVKANRRPPRPDS